MNIKKLFLGIALVFLISLAGCGIYQQSNQPDTETLIVETYEADYSVGEEIEGPVDQLISTEEIEIPAELTTESSNEPITRSINPLTDNSSSIVANMATSMKDANRYKKDEKSLKIDTKIHYYYSTLDEEGKEIYRNILGAYRGMKDSFRVDVSVDDFSTYNRMVLNEHPELFWVDSGYQYSNYGRYVMVWPRYNRDKNQVKEDQERLEDLRDGILENVPSKGGAYEKTKYIFKYLIEKTDYKIGCPDNQNIYSALINNVTVCAGYAKATQYLLQKLGIPCLYVCGHTNRGYHAWNIVKCGKHYYQVDTTWGDPNYSLSEGGNNIPDVLQYSYEYLCTDDDTMLKVRTMDELPVAPKCDDNSKSFYPLNKRYFTEYGDEVKKSIQQNIKEGKNYWHCQFSNQDAYDEMTKAVKDGLYGRMVYDITGKSTTTYRWGFNDSLVIKLYY